MVGGLNPGLVAVALRRRTGNGHVAELSLGKIRRLDHIWVSGGLGDTLSGLTILKDARGWERPLDHVPVLATLEID